jgi:16S rRNA (guanine966-N2)-methyltransferase
MQIVAGKYRHRKLHTNPGETTRPITARVKVALFDRIQPEFQDRRVADIYSGTGTIGLEALSRGARSVVFIENDRRAFDLLQQNIATLKVEAETLRWRTDVTKCSFRPKNAEGFLPLEVVFFDPPYLHTSRMRQGTMLYRSLARLAGEGVTSADALLLLRCARETEFEVPPVWVRDQVLTYSSMAVHLFRKSGPL